MALTMSVFERWYWTHQLNCHKAFCVYCMLTMDDIERNVTDSLDAFMEALAS